MSENASAAVAAPPTVSWADHSASPAAMTCPNCADSGGKALVLTVHFETPDHPLRHMALLRCDGCDCRFYDNQSPPDYTDADMLGRGRVAFYLQQGAGISLITRPLARIDRPAGSVYLEIGCGFGFGLDFAIRAKGWRGAGVDPGRIAAVGAEMLGVPIEQRYLGASEPAWRGACDVVMASETIEHVPSPRDFVATLRRTLKARGVLALTTPDGDDLREECGEGMLVPLLSPGLHLVFQTARSLRRLLEEAGFRHVTIDKDGASLVAYASDAPLALNADKAASRRLYGDYLSGRAESVARDGDLFFGFVGRALQEAVNDGDAARAETAYRDLVAACRHRFGIPLDAMTALPAEAACCSLERLTALMPLNLGGILHADAVRRLGMGVPRAALARRIELAAEAAEALRRALGELAMSDGMTETIAAASRAEALLCDASMGRADVAQRLADPSWLSDAEAAARLAERALVCAVNAGRYALGYAIAALPALAAPDEIDPQTPAARDALFCLGVLDVQRDARANPERGARRFAAVLRGLEPGAVLTEGAARGLCQALDAAWDETGAVAALTLIRDLTAQRDAPAILVALADSLRRRLFVAWVNAGDYARAKTLAPEIADGLAAEGADLSVGGRDVAFCLGVLDLQAGGDLGRGRALMERVRSAVQPAARASSQRSVATDLFWAALRGEIDAITRLNGPDIAEAHRRRALVGVAMADPGAATQPA